MLGALSETIRQASSSVNNDVDMDTIERHLEKQVERLNNPAVTIDPRIWLQDIAYLLPLDSLQVVELSPNVIETPDQRHFKLYFELRGEPHLLRCIVDRQSYGGGFEYCFYFQGKYIDQLPVDEEAQFTYWAYFRDRIVHEFKINGGD